jgi:hypothetical protein
LSRYTRLAYDPDGWALADRIWEERLAELSFANAEPLLDNMNWKEVVRLARKSDRESDKRE